LGSSESKLPLDSPRPVAFSLRGENSLPQGTRGGAEGGGVGGDNYFISREKGPRVTPARRDFGVSSHLSEDQRRSGAEWKENLPAN